MEILTATPQTVASLMLPLEEVRLLPIGDIQFGEYGCDVDRLERHLKWGMDHDCYFIGMGDYLDPISPSNRRILAGARIGMYDAARELLDEAAEKKLDDLKQILAPTRGRWLGLVSGHHYWPFEDGSTTDTRLATFLGTKYMGDGAAMTLLHFARKPPKGYPGGGGTLHGHAKIWYTHGAGSGVTPAAHMNRLLRIGQTFFAHVYLMGHIHEKVTLKKPWIDVVPTGGNNIRWNSTNRVYATTGGFLKGYELGRKNAHGYPAASYVEQKMLPPVTLGGVLILIRPKLREGYITIDTDVSS